MRHKLTGHDHAALLIAHIACTDKQLHNREIKQLATFLRTDASDVATQEINKILVEADDAIDLTSVLSAVPVTEQKRTLEIAFRMAYADGHLHLEESTLLKQIAGKWNISTGGMKAIDAKARYGTAHEDETVKKPTSPEAKIVQTLDLLFSKGLLNAVAKASDGVWQRKLRRLRHQVLFAGPEYAVAVQHCRAVAKHDFKHIKSHLKRIQKMLENLQTNLSKTIVKMDTGSQKTGNEKKKVLDSLQGLRNDLSTTLADNVIKTREGLAAKHRALQYFTVAFMGKTKAGKSTLHAVITGQGWDEIGTGKQRKTRHNRVYEIDHLRIIDTPGIGAPEADGRTDEEIALSIVDEADIICFVVTNDNQQKEEFEFLQTLKTAGKPLVILLNWKSGLNSLRKLRKFIRDADEILSPKPVADPQSKNARDVSGHLRRIRRYATKYYENDYFYIIPVHLYAAQLARKGEKPEFENELYDASKVEDFLHCIRMDILRDGAIHRSQTLLGSTAGSVETVRDWLAEKATGLYDMAAELQTSRDRFDTIMSKAESDAKQEMHSHIKSYFRRLRDQEVPEFAERHYNAKSERLGKEWQNWLKNKGLIDALQSELQATFSYFEDKVQEGLEEVGKDLEMMARMKMKRLKVDRSGQEFSWRNTVRIGGGLVGLVGGIIVVSNPIGWIAVGIGTLLGLVASFFQSKDKKRLKAVTKLRNTLRKELNSQKGKVLKEQTKEFEKCSKKLRQNVFQHFELLNESIKAIGSLCRAGEDDLGREVDSINRAYASRVLQWLTQNPKSEITLEEQVSAVNRQCGNRMEIRTSLLKQQIRPGEDVRRALQEDLEISWGSKQTNTKE
ncbi:MAG: hypothetical protein F4Z86_14770 [Gemmatimonadetes bacterium]|nr:hypothetical protein [Gemmatimonadota bacterium]MYB57986.1 hypothetical protein [Gemmatimonadota bacterium]